MKLGARILAFVLLAILAFWFTAENSRELVNVDLFLFRVRASLPLVVFGAMLVGMVAVFVVGLRADLRTRRLLSRYRDVIDVEGPALREPGETRSTIGAAVSRGATFGAVAAGETDEDPSEHSTREEGRSDDRRASTPRT